MKTTLTIEQSQRLIELGVNPYLASNEVTEKHPITENEISYPIFTLADLLGILPKRIDDYHFSIDHNGDSFDVNYLEWDDDENWEAVVCSFMCDGFAAPELINALYELTIWLIENKHIQQ